MTGQNLADAAMIHLLKRLYYKDKKMVQDAVSSFLSVVKIVNEGKEGMQADMSFHQHGPQQQFGNYGLGFFENKDVHNGTIFALYIVHGKECSANKNISYIITPASDIPVTITLSPEKNPPPIGEDISIEGLSVSTVN